MTTLFGSWERFAVPIWNSVIGTHSLQHTHTHTHTYTYIHTHTHTYTYTHIHTAELRGRDLLSSADQERLQTAGKAWDFSSLNSQVCLHSTYTVPHGIESHYIMQHHTAQRTAPPPPLQAREHLSFFLSTICQLAKRREKELIRKEIRVRKVPRISIPCSISAPCATQLRHSIPQLCPVCNHNQVYRRLEAKERKAAAERQRQMVPHHRITSNTTRNNTKTPNDHPTTTATPSGEGAA